jgi:hypothetical protein
MIENFLSERFYLKHLLYVALCSKTTDLEGFCVSNANYPKGIQIEYEFKKMRYLAAVFWPLLR